MKDQNPRLSELFKTPKRKTYTLAGITALTVGIFVFLTLRPTFVKIAELNREINDKSEFLEKIDDKLEAINSLISDKQSVTSELTYFAKDFPEEKKTGFIVANLSEIAEEKSVDLMNVEIDDDIDETELTNLDEISDVVVVEVNISIEGSLSDIEKYIEHLENFPRILDVNLVNYSKVDLSRFEGDLSNYKPIRCSVSMYMYHWSEEVEEES
ncbi:type 4a pilus biogenesis protein PilO [Patescibacteria group bacterium]